MGVKENLQEVLEVEGNNTHHLEVAVRIQFVFLVEVGKIQQNAQKASVYFDLLMILVVHFAVLVVRVHYPFQEEEVRSHHVKK